MKDGDYRITVEILQWGQPRAYAPHTYKIRATFEVIPHDTRIPQDKKQFEPCGWGEELIKEYLRAIKFWKDTPEWHEPKLEYIKNISKGVWEFMVTEAFTD